MNIDQLNNTTHDKVAACTVEVMNVLQNHDAGTQLLGITSIFRLLADIQQVDPRHLLQQSDRVMKDSLTNYWTYKFQALREYIKHEIIGHTHG